MASQPVVPTQQFDFSGATFADQTKPHVSPGAIDFSGATFADQKPVHTPTRSEMEASAPGVPNPPLPEALKPEPQDFSHRAEKALFEGRLGDLIPHIKKHMADELPSDATDAEKAQAYETDASDRIATAAAKFMANQVSVQNGVTMAVTDGLSEGIPLLLGAKRVAEAMKGAPKVLKALEVASRASVPAGVAVLGTKNVVEQGIPHNLEEATNTALGALMAGAGIAGAVGAGRSVLGENSAFPKGPTAEEAAAAAKVGGIATGTTPAQAAANAATLEAQGQNLAAQAWKNLNTKAPIPVTTDIGTVYLQPAIRPSIPDASGNTKPSRIPYHEVLDATGKRVVGGTEQSVGDWLRAHTQARETGESTSSTLVGGPNGAITTDISRPGITKQVNAPVAGAPPSPDNPLNFETRQILPADIEPGRIFQDKSGRTFLINDVHSGGRVTFTDASGEQRIAQAPQLARRMTAIATPSAVQPDEQDFTGAQFADEQPAASIPPVQTAQPVPIQQTQPEVQPLPTTAIPETPVTTQGEGNTLHVQKLEQAAEAVAPEPPINAIPGIAPEAPQIAPNEETSGNIAPTAEPQFHWQQTQAESGLSPEDHRAEVVDAIRRGEEVPAAVRAEYAAIPGFLASPDDETRYLGNLVSGANKNRHFVETKREPVQTDVNGSGLDLYNPFYGEFILGKKEGDKVEIFGKAQASNDGIRNLGVAPAYQGKGLGQALLVAARRAGFPLHASESGPVSDRGMKTIAGARESSSNPVEKQEVAPGKQQETNTLPAEPIAQASGQVEADEALLDAHEARVRQSMIRNVENDKDLTPDQIAQRVAQLRADTLGKLREGARSTLQAIRDKNPARLIEVLHLGNPSSRKLFEEATGTALPKTEGATRTAIRDFVGHDKFDAWKGEKEKAREAEEDARQAAADEKDLNLQVSNNGKVSTYKELIDRKIAEGFTHLEDTRRGAVPVAHLQNPATGFYLTLKKAAHIRYARQKIAESAGKPAEEQSSAPPAQKGVIPSKPEEISNIEKALRTAIEEATRLNAQAKAASTEAERSALRKQAAEQIDKADALGKSLAEATKRHEEATPVPEPESPSADPQAQLAASTRYEDAAAEIGTLLRGLGEGSPVTDDLRDAINKARALLDSGAIDVTDPAYGTLSRTVLNAEGAIRNDFDVLDLRRIAVNADFALGEVRTAAAQTESEDDDVATTGYATIDRVYAKGSADYRRAVNDFLRARKGALESDIVEDADGFLRHHGYPNPEEPGAKFDMKEVDPADIVPASVDAAKRIREEAYEALSLHEPLLLGDNTQSATPDDAEKNIEDTEAQAASAPNSPAVGLAKAIFQRLRARESLGNVVELTKLAEAHFGSSRTSGKWSPKDAFDAMEAGVNMYLMNVGPALMKMDVADGLDELRDLMGRLTTQATRTQEQLDLQQFSTPPTEAYVAARVAAMKPGDVMLEPSAGNGGIAVFANGAGAVVHVNEISTRRREMLEAVGFHNITEQDAEYINSFLPADVQPTVIVMNPPFSVSTRQTDQAKNRSQYGFNHVTSALQRLLPNGRLVVILGGGQANDPEGGANLKTGPSGAWFKKISGQYNIKANVRVHGKEYAKYGTSFATRIIVIDKDGPTHWESIVTGNVDRLEDAWSLLSGIAGSRPQISVSKPGKGEGTRSGGESGAGQNESETGKGRSSQPGGRGARGSETGEAGAPSDAEGGLGAGAGRPEPARNPGSGQPGNPGQSDQLHQPNAENEKADENGAAGSARGSAPNGAPERPLGDAAGAKALIESAGLDLDDLVNDIASALGAPKTETPAPKAAKPSTTPTTPRNPLLGGRSAKLPNVTPPTAPAPEPPQQPAGPPATPLDAAADAARKRLREALMRANMGIDPTLLKDLMTIGAQHMIQGATVFKDWSVRVMTDIGDLVAVIAERSNQTAQAVLRQVYALATQVATRFGITAEPPTAEDDQPLDGNETAIGEVSSTASEDAGAEQIDTEAYVKYRPSIQGPDHPAEIVETKVMSTVNTPPITYKASLPEKSLKAVSAVQMEPVLLAGQANDTRLPDGSRAAILVGDGTGVGKGLISATILFDNWNKGRKRLVWVSEKWDLQQDAARDLAMLGADSLMEGTKKNVLGRYTFATTGKLKAMNKFDGKSKIQHEGILFVTYSMLRSENKSGNTRIAQLETWLRGEDEAEGAYVLMDESHNLKNAVVGQGSVASQTGEKVRTLLANLPNMRTASLSATAATEVMNLGYLDRLGLWGPGTAFPNGFRQFVAEIGEGKIAAMEMVASELKAAGRYVSRTLSFKGVTYREREAVLTPEQKAIYRTAVRAWQSVFDKVEHSIEHTTNGGSRARSRFMAQFYGTQLRFFGVLLSTLKIPTAIEEAQQGLADGKAVLITLVNTNEAAQNREKNRARDEDDEDDENEFDFGPKEMLVNLVRENFPTQQWVDAVGANGEAIKIPLTTKDADGNEVPVLNPQAVKERDELVAQINRDLHLPANPLDILIEGLGGPDKVAELTGRRERFDEGTGKFVSRGGPNVPQKDVNVSEMNKFQNGDKLAAVLSTAAGTGISLHAGNNVANKRQRLHITLQFGWSADKQMQMFGRSHRTNQASAPEYVLLVSDLGGEKRFVSTIAKRLGSLGAITKGQSNAATGTDLMAKVNFESDEGRAATNAFYVTLLNDRPIPGAMHTIQTDTLPDDKQNPETIPVGTRVKWRNYAGSQYDFEYGNTLTEPDDYNRVRLQPETSQDPRQAVTRTKSEIVMIGEKRDAQVPLTGMTVLEYMRVLKDTTNNGRTVPPADRTNVTRLLNRLLALDPDMQNSVYDFFYDIFQATVQRAIDTGTLDTGVKQLPGETFHIAEQRTISTDPKNNAKTLYTPVDAMERTERLSTKLLRDYHMSPDRSAEDKATIWREDKSGALIARRTAKPIVHADGRIETASHVAKPSRGRFVKVADATLHKYTDVEDEAKESLREAEADVKASERQVASGEASLVRYGGADWAQRALDSAKRDLVIQQAKLAKVTEEVSDPVGKALEQWQKQYDEAPSHITVRHHLISGSVLRWWNVVSDAAPYLTIYTTVDSKTGKRVVGVEIPEHAIGGLISRIGGGGSTVNAYQLYVDVIKNNLRYTLEGGIQVQRGKVGRDNVVQLIPPNPETGKTLRDMGVLFESGLRQIYYLPEDKVTRDDVLKKLLAQFPVTQQSTQANSQANRVTGQPGDPRHGGLYLGDLDAALKKIFGKKAKTANYQAFGTPAEAEEEKANYSTTGALKSQLGTGTNLSQVRMASIPAWKALVKMASSDSVTRVTIRRAELSINQLLEHAPIKMTDLIRYYSESRLQGIRERWHEFAEQVEGMTDEELEKSFTDSFGSLLGAIENKRGIPQNVRQTAEALALRQDWDTLRALAYETFTDAGDLVSTLMEPDDFDRIRDLVQNNEKVSEADRIYGKSIEGLMAEYHSEHEGVMATALGPANRYVPLTGVVPEDGGKHGRGVFTGVRRAFKKPRNERNIMATGISPYGYDTTLEALEKGLISAVRASSKFQAIEAMEKAGMLKRYSKTPPESFRFQGEYYPAKKIEVSPSRSMIIREDGKTRTVHLAAQMAVTAPWIYKEVKPILESEHLNDNAVQRLMDPANAAAIFGPTLAIIDSHNILSTLTANTPFLGATLAEKALSAPFLKRFSASVMLARQIEPLNEDAFDDLIHMAKIGTLPAKYGAKTWSKKIAEMSGAQKTHWFDFTPFLYGPAGIDVRGRLKMYRIAKALNPKVSDEELHDFINQIGTYIPGLQSEIERTLKGVGLSPFFTRGAQMLANGVHSWTGTGPMPKKGWQMHLWQVLTGGAIALIGTWLAVSKLAGWKPVGLLKSEVKIPDDTRHSALGKQLGWDKNGTMVVDFTMFNPLVARGARAMGLLAAVDTLMEGGSWWQAIEYGTAQSASTGLQPLVGPVPRSLLVGVTGQQPYLTGIRDRHGALSLQTFPAVPPRHAGLRSFGERAVAAGLSANAMESQIGQASGFLSPTGDDGGRWLGMITDLAIPGVNPKAVNLYSRQQMLYQQRTGTR